MDDEWIFDAPDFLESVQFEQCPFLCGRFVDRLQIGSHFLEVLVGHIASRISDLVNNAFLDFGFWIAGSDHLREVTQVVYTDDEDILNPAISEVIQNTEPELAGFIFANPHTQHIFVLIKINANNHIGGLCSWLRPASL